MRPKRVLVMGIVNVTPDSFSGDGIMAAEAAVAHGLALAREGADILDVGGESTRPGHQPVADGEEMRRILPVVEALAGLGLKVSIDTTKRAVAAAALAAGARMVNDVWGLQRSPELAGLAAEHRAELVVMHNQEGTHYGQDLMAEIKRSLRESLRLAEAAGQPLERTWVDPGIGFGKLAFHNVEVLRRLAELHELGQPILLGASRKSFLERVFGQPLSMRAWGTAATVAAGVLRGVSMVRVHDVKEMLAVVRVAEALRQP
ncbi:MAG: dihydropteroate synthase [Candidatus Dormibacteraeota bacterium]|uniref:dihydropteroate synthase n=1 Tax=Candidatus Dormiibacter inghamiae TaxID=3127013 RepID=A0A934KD71_9BACT|nr:dihydropteroate synthase [Candidatus Dormibacteraeota bacterium]MBJ7605693.1 dihydropteroate synthase [Candidatus Dormibacteraeota bacterium]